MVLCQFWNHPKKNLKTAILKSFRPVLKEFLKSLKLTEAEMADVENWLKNGRRWWRNECVSPWKNFLLILLNSSYAEFF
jgi:hypothetical protein